MRDEASQRVTESPKFRDTGEALRDMTQRILRNRFYLEADWRGVKPMESQDGVDPQLFSPCCTQME